MSKILNNGSKQSDEEDAAEYGDDLPQSIQKELDKLKLDSKDIFTLRFNKPNPSFARRDVESDFGDFGKLIDIYFKENFVYVSYEKKDEAEKAIRLMHDTYNIQVAPPSKGRDKPKDTEEIAVKVSKLTADSRGWYSLRIEKPSPKFNEKDVEANFGKYGEIANIHFTDKFIYIRYLTWKAASNAIRGIDNKFKLDVANVSAKWKPQKSHADKGPQIYIGNISSKASREYISEMLEKFKPGDFSFYSINNRNFAFAFFESAAECKKVVSELNGKVIRGSALHVRICRDRSRARYIAEDDYKSEKEVSVRRGVPKDFNSMSPFGQGFVELYVSNFNWNVTKAQLEKLFSAHGQVAYVELMNIKKGAGECRKAYVGMYDSYEAKQTQHKLNQRKWMELTLNVNYSTRKPSGQGARQQGSVNSAEFDSNPVDKALAISNKLDIMLDEVLDRCDFCTKIHVMVSQLQQAMREIKYQALRGEVQSGLSLLGDLLNQAEQEQKAKDQEQLMYQQKQHQQALQEREFYGQQQQQRQIRSLYDNDKERELQLFREGGWEGESYYGGGGGGGGGNGMNAMMQGGGNNQNMMLGGGGNMMQSGGNMMQSGGNMMQSGGNMMQSGGNMMQGMGGGMRNQGGAMTGMGGAGRGILGPHGISSMHQHMQRGKSGRN